ncbi:MAG: aminotransferase class IV [Bryobacteraceae bacterium]
MHRYILHNGDVRDATEAVLRAGQVGLLSGWGVFSTIKVIDGVLFAFERHWARMQRDAALLRVPMPADPEPVHAALLKLVKSNQASNATLRLVVVRNGGGMWEGPPTGRPSDVIALTAPLKEWGSGVKLTVVPQARYAASVFAGTKVLSWSQNLTWLEEAQSRGFDEVILLNERDEVAECTSANLFAARGSEVWTPPLSSGCLPGVTRDVLLHEVHCEGTPILERTLTVSDLDSADDVFITSTTRELLPVLSIDGRTLRHSGQARETLQRAFSAYVNRYVEERRSALVG